MVLVAEETAALHGKAGGSLLVATRKEMVAVVPKNNLVILPAMHIINFFFTFTYRLE